MRFGIRRPSLTKKLAARASFKRAIRHRLGLKAPRGMGRLIHPKRAAYNRLYRRTTRGCAVAWVVSASMLFMVSGTSCGHQRLPWTRARQFQN